ncbi:kinase-like protein [Ceratobasidium sp. AG-I]|nr:kinase-like protein [Ceratobasidium sp. AG-I]
MSTHEVITLLGNHGCQDITDRLDLVACGSRPIANGGFGDVYRGKLLDSSQVAIKTMRILINTSETQKPLKNAARELHTCSKCQHPNVLSLLGLVGFRDQIGMVSPWMENGSLPSFLEKYPEADRCQLSAEICEGLAYLHAVDIAHGDLKGLNVLISGNGTPMLTDFGNAVLQESTLQFTATTTKTSLSPRWAAPELMEGVGMHSFAADVYALGMTILKEPPARPEDLIPSNNRDGEKLWSLLKWCWMFESENRPGVDEVRDIMKTITQDGLKVVQVEEIAE